MGVLIHAYGAFARIDGVLEHAVCANIRMPYATLASRYAYQSSKAFLGHGH
jgi:hypothetical protein